MTTVKRINDLSKYTGVLPYASELFGVYQPLLGWKSKRLEERFSKKSNKEKSAQLIKLQKQFSDQVDLIIAGRGIEISINPAILKDGKKQPHDSILLKTISANLPAFEHYEQLIWASVITSNNLNSLLNNKVKKHYSDIFDKNTHHTREKDKNALASVLKKQLQNESSIAGALLFLVNGKSYGVLESIFYNSMDREEQAVALLKAATENDTSTAFMNIDKLDPTDREQLKSVSLSPISVVHLFRQYFFELDTFLGTPESHVWLSPGSSAELIEEHTRKSTVEKSFESSLDIFTKSESTETVKDEISDAVSEENSNDMNLGASVTAEYTNVSATASFDYTSSQNTARETSHKSMREKTTKLSSEIRKNYKTTFRTVDEFTEFKHTKHILANTTDKLINYELRRKMRQVGVQVQDVGTYLCWQTYVDDPGKDLGLAKLIHIAQSAELDGLVHPEEIPRLQTSQEKRTATIPFIATNPEGADKDEVYVNGEESDGNNEGWGSDFETIKAEHDLKFISPYAKHNLTQVEFDSLGMAVTASLVSGTLKSNNGIASFTLNLDSVNFEGQSSIKIGLILHWTPDEDANTDIDAKNIENSDNFKADEKAAYESAYIETVKDRINATSTIRARKKEELREEERIIIYRRLIQDMLLNNVSADDDKTRHVLAELINYFFDVNKMLYFVAPEWWRPRLHRSKQQLYETTAKPTQQSKSGLFKVKNLNDAQILANEVGEVATNEDPSNVNPNVLIPNTAGWGEIGDTGRDNYYITEDSAPAKFGSSLGWLMQLDGDNRRNTFLNAPWVKAVMPIRPGKEKAAINWLKAVEGMNGITSEDLYQTDNSNETDMNGDSLHDQPMLDVLMDLAAKIEKKHKAATKSDDYPKESEVSDPALVDEGSTVTATPIDRVYEHGFFPLKNSFRANIPEEGSHHIFDQWIEVLPTDQTVPVEVEYDPKTGRQV